MKLRNKTIAYLDLETTGLLAGHHEIIEACVLKKGICYHVYVEPEHLERANTRALEVNGYNLKEWGGAISQKHLANDLANLLENCIIIGHNPQFDIEFIECLFEEHHVPVGVDRRAIDTTTLAFEHLVPLGLDSLSMDSIRRFLKWPIVRHNALDDAKDVKRLYELLTRHRGFYLTYVQISKWFGLL